MPADPTRRHSPSTVPPVLDGHHPPIPEPLEWQKQLPDAAGADTPHVVPRRRSGLATKRVRDKRQT